MRSLHFQVMEETNTKQKKLKKRQWNENSESSDKLCAENECIIAEKSCFMKRVCALI